MFNSIQEVDAVELSDWISADNHEYRLVDVREIREQAQGVVPGSEPVPLATLPARMNEFSREDKLVIVCRSGARSAQACMFLQQQGYENVYNLRGGIMGWVGNNLPIAEHVPLTQRM